MGWSALIGALSTAATVSESRRQSKVAKANAESQRVQDAATAAANRQAAEQASRREQLAAQVKADETAAAEQMGVTPEVTAASEESSNARRRRVQAEFNTGDAGVAGGIVGLRV